LIRIEARIFEAKLLQTAILNIANHESLIATKYARIRQSAPRAKFLEAGARRAQGIDAAYFGTRASYLAGFDVTSLASAGRDFGIPCGGTMEHADIQFHDDELTAFRTFASHYPDQTTLLVDTYDTLKSGLPNAITVAKELQAKGHKLRGIRIDSGDLSYLSKRARNMLDEAGFPEVDIVLSGDLDEYVIQDLRIQGAQANTFLVGTRGITAYEQPALGMVYKLVAREVDGELTPVIKVSSSKAKTTTPHIKELEAVDLIDVRDPSFRNRVEQFKVERLLEPIFKDGELIYTVPTIEEIRHFHETQIGRLWEEYKRLRLPEIYAVTFSDRLWKLKLDMIRETRLASGLK